MLTAAVRLTLAGGLAAAGSKEVAVALGVSLGADFVWAAIRARLKDNAATKKREEQISKGLDVDTDPLEQLKEARDRITALEAQVAQYASHADKISALEEKQLEHGQKLAQASQTAYMANNKVNAQGKQLSAVQQEVQRLGVQQSQLEATTRNFTSAVQQSFEQQDQYFKQRVQQAVAEQVPLAVAAEIQRLQAAGIIPPPVAQQHAAHQAPANQLVVGQQARATGAVVGAPPQPTRKGRLSRAKDRLDRALGREPTLTPSEQYYKDLNEQTKQAAQAKADAEAANRQQGRSGAPAAPYPSTQAASAPAPDWRDETGHGYRGPDPTAKTAAPQTANNKRSKRTPLTTEPALTPRPSKKKPRQA